MPFSVRPQVEHSSSSSSSTDGEMLPADRRPIAGKSRRRSVGRSDGVSFRRATEAMRCRSIDPIVRFGWFPPVLAVFLPRGFFLAVGRTTLEPAIG